MPRWAFNTASVARSSGGMYKLLLRPGSELGDWVVQARGIRKNVTSASKAMPTSTVLVRTQADVAVPLSGTAMFN